jgi:hypothetical protein
LNWVSYGKHTKGLASTRAIKVIANRTGTRIGFPRPELKCRDFEAHLLECGRDIEPQRDNAYGTDAAGPGDNDAIRRTRERIGGLNAISSNIAQIGFTPRKE